MRIDGKGSLRSVWQAEIALTDPRVPEENRLPGANSFKDTGRVLAGTRNAVAWAALGHATAAYEVAATYRAERKQFGEPLVSFQIVQEKLVKMLAEICSMQLYCLRVGRLIEEGKLTDTIAAIAKMNNNPQGTPGHRLRLNRPSHPPRRVRRPPLLLITGLGASLDLARPSIVHNGAGRAGGRGPVATGPVQLHRLRTCSAPGDRGNFWPWWQNVFSSVRVGTTSC